MLLEQVLGLILEVVEVGIGWEASYRHDELPFVCPRSALTGRKSVRESELLRPGGLLSFPRTGCALRAAEIIAHAGGAFGIAVALDHAESLTLGLLASLQLA